MSFKILNGAEYFYQWDLGQKLIVEGDFCKVHFCNQTDDCALVVEVYEEGGQKLANVPNILLQSANNIRVYGICKDGDNIINTNEYEIFRVIRRGKPESYVYTEDEVLNYETLEKRVTALESTPATPEGTMVFKGDMGYSKPTKPNKGEVYYCSQDVVESKDYFGINYNGYTDYIGEGFVVGLQSDLYNILKEVYENNSSYTLYKKDSSGNILFSIYNAITAVDDGSKRVDFSGATQTELTNVFGSAGVIDVMIYQVVVKPLLKDRIVMYTGEEWIVLRGDNY